VVKRLVTRGGELRERSDMGGEAAHGEIRAYPERKRTVIGAMDLLIPAHARSLSLTLATNNIGEFERVPGLLTENLVTQVKG
jgi:predicted nucleic acid-binding protein